MATVRWHGFPHNKELTPEAVISKWDLITSFCERSDSQVWLLLTFFYAADGRVTYPTSPQDSFQRLLENAENIAPDDSPSDAINEALKVVDTSEFTYNDHDVILYNLGIGATEKDVQWIFEGHDQFQALPTFGVIPQFLASSGLSLDFLPNFNPVRYLSRHSGASSS
jgi:multifunctional beta-oxidation protein